MIEHQNDFEGSRLVFYDNEQSSNALSTFLGRHKRINRESILDFLLFGSIMPPHTPLEGVGQLFPGERKKGDSSGLAFQNLSYQQEHSKTIEEFVIAFEACLDEYISQRPQVASVLLSGGIDSATILSFLPKSAECITWGGRGETSDDVTYSRMTTKALGVSAHEVVLADFERDFELYKDAIRTLKVPMLFNSSVPFLRMAEVGKEKRITDWFVGQNADTLFMSYPAPVLTKNLSIINTFFPFNPLSFFASRKKFLTSTSHTIKLLAYFKSLGVYPGSWISVPEAYFEAKKRILDTIPAVTKEQRIIVTEELMTESRRNQLCQNEIPHLYGITAHCPYYSQAFTQLALSVPDRLRQKSAYGKVILKELAKRRGVPEEVIYKQKSGLSYGFTEFIKEKRHLAMWDAIEADEDLNKYIQVKALRDVEQDNYLTFIMLMSLHLWFDLVARPEGLQSV